MFAQAASIIWQVIAVVLFADLVSGLIHWAQDRYSFGSWRFLSHIVILFAPAHHRDPIAFTELSWWARNRSAIPVSIIALFGIFDHFIAWQIALLVVLIALSGEIHYFAHKSDGKYGALAKILQRLGLIQSPDHHGVHHITANSRYCIITNYMNPVLDSLGFFRRLEAMLP